MAEMQTIEEIEAQFRPDWVLISDYVLDEFTQLRSGRVLFHDPDRDKVYQRALELRPARSAVLFLGEMPDDLALLL